MSLTAMSPLTVKALLGVVVFMPSRLVELSQKRLDVPDKLVVPLN